MKGNNVIPLFPIPEVLVGKISQAAWDTLTPELRNECERMAREFEKGAAKYAPAAARYAELQEYHEMAERSGTTLKAALERYINLENAIRADPAQGICIVLKNIGRDPVEWAKSVLASDDAASELESAPGCTARLK
jgi:hypothetical protein